jgi:hypothetical protein
MSDVFIAFVAGVVLLAIFLARRAARGRTPRPDAGQRTGTVLVEVNPVSASITLSDGSVRHCGSDSPARAAAAPRGSRHAIACNSRPVR